MIENNCKSINSLSEFIQEVNKDIKNTNIFNEHFWFRGENKELTPLLPKLYRFIKKDIRTKIENDMNQEFRMRASALYNKTPDYDRIDEWLFLMQHNGLFTRLLDWTTGALIALFFAISEAAFDHKNEYSPVVWMLNPIALNFICNKRLFLPLSWNDGSNWYLKNYPYSYVLTNLYNNKSIIRKCPSNILSAWAAGKCLIEEEFPIALKPQHVHPRVTAQRGCFTVFGKRDNGLEEMFKNSKINDILNSEHKILYDNKVELDKFLENNGEKTFNEIFLIKYKICPDKRVLKNIVKELFNSGICNATLMPDLEGLSKELINKYWNMDNNI